VHALAKVIGWFGKQAINYVAILAVVVAGFFIYGEWFRLEEVAGQLAQMRAGLEEAKKAIVGINAKVNAETRSAANNLQAVADEADRHLKELEGRRQKTWDDHPLERKLHFSPAYLEILKLDFEIDARRQQVKAIKSTAVYSQASAALRQQEAALITAIKAQIVSANGVIAQWQALVNNNPKFVKIPFTPQYNQLQNLMGQHAGLTANRADLDRRLALVQSAIKLKQANLQQAMRHLNVFKIDQSSQDKQLIDLMNEIATKEVWLAESWIGKYVNPRAPLAASILLGALLLPFAIRLCFYGLAHLISKAAAVVLLPGVSGLLGAVPGSSSANGKISDTSITLQIAPSWELLVQQSITRENTENCTKSQQLFLSWKYWFASLVTGMFNLTKLRPFEGTQDVQIKLTVPADAPFDEIGMISLPAGTAIVLHPHFLVGILQRQDQPLRIESLWRWGSLHGWLTLRFRYFVFHGPTALIVKGGRGVHVNQVRVEGSDIDQAQVLGFSANLEYRMRRGGTLVEYFLGKQSLFKDRFKGDGFYISQEIPTWGGTRKFFGKGWEGVVDAGLKAFGY